MGLKKKVLKGTAAVSTFGASVAAEKAVKAMQAKGEDVTDEQGGAGILWVGMSHEEGRNAHIRLYANRIEREKPRSRVSFQKAVQDNEVIPIKSVTSVNVQKDGMLFSKVLVMSAGGTIPFRFRHEDAQRFKNTIMPLVLGTHPTVAGPTPAVPSAPTHTIPEQIKQLADLRDAGAITSEEYEAKKAELLSRM